MIYYMNKKRNTTLKNKKIFTKKRKNYKKKSRKMRQKKNKIFKGGNDPDSIDPESIDPESIDPESIDPDMNCDDTNGIDKHYNIDTKVLKESIKTINWPTNTGCEDNTKEIVIIKKDTLIDRFGGEYGFYFCIAVNNYNENIDYLPKSYSSRSLPYAHETGDFTDEIKEEYSKNINNRNYHVYKLNSDILSIRCKIKPAYCGTGGVYQYLAINSGKLDKLYSIFSKCKNITESTDECNKKIKLITENSPIIKKFEKNKNDLEKNIQDENKYNAKLYLNIFELKRMGKINDFKQEINNEIKQKLKYKNDQGDQTDNQNITIIHEKLNDEINNIKTDNFYKSLSEDVSLISHLDNTDFVLENYQSHPPIKAPLSN